MLVFRWLKRLTCRHEKLTYSSTFLDEIAPNEYKTPGRGNEEKEL